MKIHIQAQDFSPKNDLVALVHEKVSKVERFSDQVIECRVVLRVEKAEKRNNKICEIRAVIPGNDLFVKKQMASFEEAVQKATETLQRQVKAWKQKIRQ